MVGVAGLEPATSALSGLRSNQLSYTPKQLDAVLQQAYGGNRVRTGDPELAKLVLCQLSYAPAGYRPSSSQNNSPFRTGSGVTHNACASIHRNNQPDNLPGRRPGLATRTVDHNPVPTSRDGFAP